MQQLEERLKRHIIKSRPYFEEKSLCQEQLNTQRDRVKSLERQVSQVKFEYSQSLKRLELISEEIHQRRKRSQAEECPAGPREPGVGAELSPLDLEYDIEGRSVGSMSSSAVSADEDEDEDAELDDLKLRVKRLAVRPIDGGEGCSYNTWESELSATVDKLDHMLMMKESAGQQRDDDGAVAGDKKYRVCVSIDLSNGD